MPSGGSAERASHSTETSRSLLALVKESDPQAWNRLVSLYSPLIYYWCQRMELPDQDIPDIFQEVFQAVARNIASFRRTRPEDTFRGWLRAVTRNKARDYYRRVGRQPRAIGGTAAQARFSELLSPDDDDDDFFEEPDESGQEVYRELLCQALASIRPHFHERTWRAFWRSVVDGRDTDEVARELSMRPGTVRVSKSRVLHRLRQELGDVLD